MNPTAGQSILRAPVSHAELMSAVSLYSVGFNFARIVGPSIGGVLILCIGVGGCMGFYGVCLLIPAIELLGVRAQRARRPVRRVISFNELKGRRWFRRASSRAYVISIFVAT